MRFTCTWVFGSYAINRRVGAASWLASGAGNSYAVIWNSVLLTLTARRNTCALVERNNAMGSEQSDRYKQSRIWDIQGSLKNAVGTRYAPDIVSEWFTWYICLTHLLSPSASVVDELVSVGLCIFDTRKMYRCLLEGTVQTAALEEYREVCPVLKIPITVAIPCA